MNWALHFLGTGDSGAVQTLGASAAVVEADGAPVLLIDCGPDVVDRYLARYDRAPEALYVTHTHLDHVGGFERLFGLLRYGPRAGTRTRVFTHAAVVPLLHGRVGDHPRVAAEGGVNFWDPFQLVPCTRGFWLAGQWWALFPTRHHAPGTSWGVALPGALVFTGDTRPIPEVLAQVAARGELVAHDCGLVANPSHTGLEDLARAYPAALRERLVLYHYGSVADGAALAAAGLRVARPGDTLALAPPLAPSPDAG